MIFGILIIGLILIASALKNTEHELGGQLQADVLGANGFLAWAGAILMIGGIGYVPGLRTASRYLLALLAVVVVLRNGGLFANAQQALQQAAAAGPAPPIATLSSSSSSSSSGSSSGSSGSSGGSGGIGGSGVSYAEVAQVAALAVV